MIARTSPIMVLMLLVSMTVVGEAEEAEIRTPQTEAWIGQRLTFYVDLRAKGSFAGAASFSLPQVPRTVILKVGNPVVSSDTRDGESYFIQTHQFSMFSQQTGTIEIPAFEVRFGSRDGFTGPVKEWQMQVPSATVEIKRPPGSENLGFISTAESFEVVESWDPEPSDCEVGAVFKRTITVQADQVTGMALPPPPEFRSEKIRIYPGQPEVVDKTERGDFLGKRSDTITYLVRGSGEITFPSITYVWWNPKDERLHSATLESRTFTVSSPPSENAAAPPNRQIRLPVVLVGCAVIVVFWLARHRMIETVRNGWAAIFTPERIAAHQLHIACQRNDPEAALNAWELWQRTQSTDFKWTEELSVELIALTRWKYGPDSGNAWNGKAFSQAFSDQRLRARATHRDSRELLPELNPRNEKQD